MWRPFQVELQVTDDSHYVDVTKDLPNIRRKKRRDKKTTLTCCPYTIWDATSQVENLLLLDFWENFNCGAVWLVWYWTYLGIRYQSENQVNSIWPLIWQAALCSMAAALWAGIMLSLPSAAPQREWLRPSLRRRVSILRYLGCSFRYWCAH